MPIEPEHLTTSREGKKRAWIASPSLPSSDQSAPEKYDDGTLAYEASKKGGKGKLPKVQVREHGHGQGNNSLESRQAERQGHEAPSVTHGDHPPTEDVHLSPRGVSPPQNEALQASTMPGNQGSNPEIHYMSNGSHGPLDKTGAYHPNQPAAFDFETYLHPIHDCDDMWQDWADNMLSIKYEDFKGGEPRSSSWHTSHILYLRGLLEHLPNTGVAASEYDYLGSTIFSSYEEWRESFEKFADVIHIAQSSSIQAAQNMDGSVFWGAGGAILKIPDIFQSAFMYCPLNHDSGLIDKWLVDVLNMAKHTYERHNRARGKPRMMFGTIQAVLRFMCPNWRVKMTMMNSPISVTMEVPRVKSGADIPDIEVELVNLQAEQDDLENQLQGDDPDDGPTLAEGGVLLSHMRKISQALWSQYMRVVTHLSHKWGVKISRILVEGGAVPSPSASRAKNLWNAFLHSEKEKRSPEENINLWKARMREKYTKLFEGLNNDEKAARKEDLLKEGDLMKKKDFTDGPATQQNCVITGSPELTEALNPYKDKILSELYAVVQTANYAAGRPGASKNPQTAEHLKHAALLNWESTHAALSTFMHPILEPHGIGSRNAQKGPGWVFPGKQLGLKLSTKKYPVDPADNGNQPLIQNEKGKALLHLSDILKDLPKK
ncbi:hypothetical protein BS47DRAFT_1364320 [Hydnum rufescens UP504]|uniref:Uncharacterized protein n=1 Tax=Hydnum rufescens UP504 TaxID=1448309 RepID=A0A9P6ARV6_9AGAM|nr:hypothetical protein BS47DRAFT_1364320 [Hydnum rufescens UP504]